MSYTPYSNRKHFPLHREKRELLRAAVDVESLDQVFDGLMRKYQSLECKCMARMSAHNPL